MSWIGWALRRREQILRLVQSGRGETSLALSCRLWLMWECYQTPRVSETLSLDSTLAGSNRFSALSSGAAMKQCTITQLGIASSLTLLAMTESFFGFGLFNCRNWAKGANLRFVGKPLGSV